MKNELTKLLSTMYLPPQRKSTLNKNNLQWLARNIAIKNSQHKNFNRSVEIIKELLKNGEYDS